jgi:hypothetical protein
MKKACWFVAVAALLLAALSPVLAQAPVMSVKITGPGSGTRFAKCSEVDITVDPQITGGEIKNVTLYRNNVGVTARIKAPWEFKLKNYPPGYYVFTAKLTAKTGETVYSDPVYVTVGDAEKGNIAMNGEFDCGPTPWTLGLAGGTGSVATFTIDTSAGISTGAAAVVTIANGGTANWHVQLAEPMAVDSGHTYVFSFTAQSTENAKAIDIAIQMNRDPWTVYYQVSPTIEALQDYGPFTWECPVTDHDAWIRFNIGNTNDMIFWLDNVKWIDASLTGLKDRKPLNADAVPSRSLLSRNYPNPFNPGTTIQYRLPEEGAVTLTLYNLRGQAVRTLVRENQNPGDHSILWNGANEAGERVPSGVYVYRLTVKTADRTSTLSRKIMMLE